MRWRVELPGAIYRQAREKAGDDKALTALVVQWLTTYASGDSIQAQGGRAAAAAMSQTARTARARAGGRARWRDHEPAP